MSFRIGFFIIDFHSRNAFFITIFFSKILQFFLFESMANDKLDAIPTVHIDYSGRFKYILMKVFGQEQADGVEPFKLIVRGYQRAQWHGEYLLADFATIFLKNNEMNRFFTADIYEEVSGSIRCLGFDTECLGGGRIEHFPEKKLIKVYGHSTVSIYIYSFYLELLSALYSNF